MDMSPAFTTGIGTCFPNSAIVYNRLHLKKLLNESMDTIRKLERKKHKLLKGRKYTFLKKQENLTADQKHATFELMDLLPALGDGIRFVEWFDDFFSFHDKEQAAIYPAWWCDQVEDSGIFPFRKFLAIVRAYWSGIVNWYDNKISNGVLEGINSKVQLAKRRAGGFRSMGNFINLIYLIAGDLDFAYPQKTIESILYLHFQNLNIMFTSTIYKVHVFSLFCFW